MTVTRPSLRPAARARAHSSPPPACQSCEAAGSAAAANSASAALHLGPHDLVPILAILLEIGDARLGDGVGRDIRHLHIDTPARRFPDGREDLLALAAVIPVEEYGRGLRVRRALGLGEDARAAEQRARPVRHVADGEIGEAVAAEALDVGRQRRQHDRIGAARRPFDELAAVAGQAHILADIEALHEFDAEGLGEEGGDGLARPAAARIVGGDLALVLRFEHVLPARDLARLHDVGIEQRPAMDIFAGDQQILAVIVDPLQPPIEPVLRIGDARQQELRLDRLHQPLMDEGQRGRAGEEEVDADGVRAHLARDARHHVARLAGDMLQPEAGVAPKGVGHRLGELGLAGYHDIAFAARRLQNRAPFRAGAFLPIGSLRSRAGEGEESENRQQQSHHRPPSASTSAL
jgi:hypothetical protein